MEKTADRKTIINYHMRGQTGKTIINDHEKFDAFVTFEGIALCKENTV